MLQRVEDPKVRLAAGLADPQCRTALEALAAARIGEDACVAEISRLTEAPESQTRFGEIRAALNDAAPVAPGAFERAALLLTAMRATGQIEDLPVAPGVKRRIAAIFNLFPTISLGLKPGRDRFVALAKIASLRRFPAGLFDWESSGLPRSWLPRIRPASQLARTVALVGGRWRGFGPVFFAHLTVCRPVRALLQRDAESCYYLMAKSLELQPDVKGFVTSSWFFSADTFRVTPHLAWLNEVFRANGGIVATMGRAEPDCGVLARSPERQRAFEEGRFTPTLGLIVWPREEMIAWAARRPDLES